MGKWTRFFSGVIVGAVLCTVFTATAQAGSGLLAQRSAQQVTVDGRQIELDAYLIEDSNYVKLRDVGELLDFNVYWLDGVFVDSASPYTGEPPETAASMVDAEAVRQEMIRLTNELRTEKGLPALVQDGKLMEAAQVRAEEMAATGVYDHVRPDGRSRSTVTDCPYTTENIHRISASRLTDPSKDLAETAVGEWAASKVHLEAMLDAKRSAIGVGAAQGVDPETGRTYWYCVQWFLRTGYSITKVDAPVLNKSLFKIF